MNYGEVFMTRGERYERAMRRFPAVRAGEFRAVVDLARIGERAAVVDVPAGGGYLRPYLPAGTGWTGIDTAGSFLAAAERRGEHVLCASDFGTWPLRASSATHVVSIAGLHHETVRLPFYREAFRVLEPGGSLVIAEVAEESRVALFLDGFVDRHGEGHKGVYFGLRDREWLDESGFHGVDSSSCDVAWRAPSLDELAQFVMELFALEGTSVGEIGRVLEAEVGVSRSGSDVVLHWEMVLTRAEKG